MFKKIPLRIRLSILSMILLTISCVGLTVILNFSATKMVDLIEVTPKFPTTTTEAYNIYNNYEVIPSVPLQTQAARKVFKNESIVYMILIISVGGLLTYYLSGKALKPLNELNLQIKNITVHNLSEDIKLPEAKDEL